MNGTLQKSPTLFSLESWQMQRIARDFQSGSSKEVPHQEKEQLKNMVDLSRNSDSMLHTYVLPLRHSHRESRSKPGMEDATQRLLEIHACNSPPAVRVQEPRDFTASAPACFLTAAGRPEAEVLQLLLRNSASLWFRACSIFVSSGIPASHALLLQGAVWAAHSPEGKLWVWRKPWDVR